MDYIRFLKGGDFRSLGESAKLLQYIKNQDDFDSLFEFLFHPDDLVRMRASDVIEKVTLLNRHYLHTHKKVLIAKSREPLRKEIKWHYALFLSRLSLTKREAGIVWNLLSHWVCDRKESRIVRVNALQALSEIKVHFPELENDFNLLVLSLEKENLPSINARIRKINSHRKAKMK